MVLVVRCIIPVCQQVSILIPFSLTCVVYPGRSIDYSSWDTLVVAVYFYLIAVVARCVTAMILLTSGCSAASNWKPGPHAVSTIVKCL